MSVAIITPAGSLPSKADPVVFTTTRPVVSIAVEYNPAAGTGPRETIYDGTDATNQNGSFSHLYRLSHHVGSTWTIVRDNGWPAAFELRVKEV